MSIARIIQSARSIRAASALLALTAALLAGCDDVQQAAELRAAEAVGDVAARVLDNAGDTQRAADLINLPVEVRQLHDIVYQARGVGNVQLVETSEGHVVFDTGLAIQSAKQRRLLGDSD